MKCLEIKKRLNKNYGNKFRSYKTFDNSLCIYYNYYADCDTPYYMINYRDLRYKNYRKKIACFLTDKKTKYKVPKNY